jgi:hypothetical protein
MIGDMPASGLAVGSTDSSKKMAQALRARMALTALRLGLGLIWSLNLLFVFAPTNQFFSTFSLTAQGFGPSTLGGPWLASFVAAHPLWFSAVVAGITLYLAVAFVLGWTTRAASVIGAIFSIILLLTQFGSVFAFPGGTDVGPHPLYLAIYVTLFLSPRDLPFSLDTWLGRRISIEASSVDPTSGRVGKFVRSPTPELDSWSRPVVVRVRSMKGSRARRGRFRAKRPRAISRSGL